MTCPSSVRPGDFTFATRFFAVYLFLKVKGCRPMTYQHLTLRMFESAKRNDGMVDQKSFKTAKRYGFDSVYFDECSMDVIEKYIKYIRLLLTPTCEYVLVNRNGKQFQKLTELFSVLVFEAIGKYIHPTRYRQIIETQSCEVLPPSEQKWISEDQKHSSTVARVHYQKKRSREVAMRGRWCMQKLLEESKSMENDCDSVDQSPPIENPVSPTNLTEKLPTRRAGIRLNLRKTTTLDLA